MNDDAGTPAEDPQGLRCDFCGERVERVRRVALDRGYDRLQKPHTVRFACNPCSEAKQQRRAEFAEG